jgi:hypothetical protein
LLQEVSPTSTLEFEQRLQGELRELARQIAEWTYNRLSPEHAADAPHDVQHTGQGYRRLNEKTPHRNVATRFGKITLWRHGYRPWERDAGEPTIFPLERQLGLVEGATPALAEAAARYLAETGATHQTVLERLRREHGVTWGVEKLRSLGQNIATAMSEFRRDFQTQRVLDLLRQAADSRGKRKIVLAAGRDGITLCTQPHSFFEVATTATLTVYDRRGRRLGSVFLAYAPELGQGTMSDELAALIRDVLAQWEGPPPRLCYVTDAGDSEVKFYRQVLRPMRHPRTGQRLSWQWIVDYYHTALRITTMAEALFGDTPQAHAWAAKLRKLLKKPNGPARVLWSAAQMRSRHGLAKSRRKQFQQAYNFLRKRTGHMQYAQFRSQGLPIGSGITEAACKTVFTQRLKLSGMRWGKPGAQVILNLRVCLLSGVWDETYRAVVASYNALIPRIHTSPTCPRRRQPR